MGSVAAPDSPALLPCESKLPEIRASEAARVLFLMSDLGGGSGNHMLGMTRCLDPAVCRAELLSLAQLTAREKPQIPVAYLRPNRFVRRYPFAQWLAYRKIRRFVAAKSIDIVHAYFFWPIVYARMLKHAGIITRLVENREDAGFNWGFHEYSWLRLTRGTPDEVICVSEAVRRVVIAKEGIPSERTRVIHNGVPRPQMPMSSPAEIRRQLGFPAKALLVGMVANLNRAVKGGEDFVRSLPEIVRHVPQARFVVVGLSDQQALMRLASDLGVAQFLVFAGERRNIQDYYGAFDVSVLTSLSEGFSITLLESMNHGVPVVATCVGGNPEAIVDSETGFLTPPGDPGAFASRVVELLRDKPLRQKLGAAGRSRVQKCFQLKDVAAKYCETYQGLCRSE